MRCLSCNAQLNDREATRKYATTGTFIDLCDRCFGHVAEDIPHLEGNGADASDDYEDEFSDELGQYDAKD